MGVVYRSWAAMSGLFCFHRLDQDELAQVGKDQEIKALSEMNEMQQFENDVWSSGRE